MFLPKKKNDESFLSVHRVGFPLVRRRGSLFFLCLPLVFIGFLYFGFSSHLAAQASFGGLAEDETQEEEETPKPEKKTTKGANKKTRASFKKAGEKSDSSDVEKNGCALGTPHKKRYRFGMEFEARPGGACSNLFGSAPIPIDWPEQKVQLIEEAFPVEARTGYRTVKEGGCAQMLFQMPILQAGQKIEASSIIEVTRYPLLPPKDPSIFVIPEKMPKSLRQYLDESPYIEKGDRKVKKIARQLEKENEADNGWTKVDKVMKYVREHVRYKEEMKEKPVRGAVAAIETGEGDCEDMSALFIAILRNMGIPARTVRVPEHCWAEFYLEDEEGNGYWFPAEVSGNLELGATDNVDPILQKGDAFNLPESPRETVRYVKELFTGDVRQNGPDPKVQFIREEVNY